VHCHESKKKIVLQLIFADSNVPNEDEVSDEDEDDEVSKVPNEDEALDPFNFNMNFNNWIDWALTSS
jgi:hypothetical protein